MDSSLGDFTETDETLPTQVVGSLRNSLINTKLDNSELTLEGLVASERKGGPPVKKDDEDDDLLPPIKSVDTNGSRSNSIRRSNGSIGAAGGGAGGGKKSPRSSGIATAKFKKTVSLLMARHKVTQPQTQTESEGNANPNEVGDNNQTPINKSSQHRKQYLRELYGMNDNLSVAGGGGQDSVYGDGTDRDDTEEFEFRMGDPIHDDYFKVNALRNSCGAFINSTAIQAALMTFIVCNALILGALTFLYDHPKETKVLEKVDLTLLAIFTVEICMQAFYLGNLFFRNQWLMFDSAVILLSWIFVDSSTSVFRSFRIFRVFTIIPHWGALRRLVVAVGKTLPKMATIWISLGIFFYVFSVLFTDLYHGLWDSGYLDYDYFGRLDHTALTLFQFMTLDSWTGVVRQVQERHHWASLGFVAWVIITAFFVLNLMIGVICESLIELQSLNEEKRQRRAFKDQRRLINNQTEYLHEEMSRMVELQKEMIASQLAMQEMLLDIAAATGVVPDDSSAAEAAKGRMQSIVNALGNNDDRVVVHRRTSTISDD